MVAELLGQPVPGPVRAALAEAGAEVQGCRVRQVSWSPGSSIRVSYDVLLQDPAASAEQSIAVVAAAGRIPDGAFVVGDGQDQVAVWRPPHDPALPGLASALDPDTAGALLEQLGASGGQVRTRLRAYRPSRRAVVAITGRDHGLYLKVVRPEAVVALHRRHLWLAQRLPVTHSLGYDPALGVLALQSLPGQTLRACLQDQQAALPEPARLVSLLAALPPPQDQVVTYSPISRVPASARLLTSLLPEHATRIRQVATAIGEEHSEPSGPVHGDFYDGQVLVHQGEVTGVIDLDTYGWGRPADDAGTMLGHLSAAQGMSRQGSRVAGFGAAMLAQWARDLDPVDIRLRTAATVLTLAPGAFRSQVPDWPAEVMRRVELAAAWVDSAGTVSDGPG